jgi:hypothetical protein
MGVAEIKIGVEIKVCGRLFLGSWQLKRIQCTDTSQ